MQAPLPALAQAVTLPPLQVTPLGVSGVLPREPTTPRQGHSSSASGSARDVDSASLSGPVPTSGHMPGVSGISPSRRSVVNSPNRGSNGVPLRVARGGRAGGIARKRNTSPRTVARRVGGGAHLGGNGGVTVGTGTTTTSSGGGGGTGSADAVLPRGSVVKITGNNRTKRELLNRQGLVLSAQTLGGWHEVALHDGATVRVQRNALTLLDAPSAATVAMLPPAAHPPTRTSDALAASIARLDDASLRRYKRHHRLQIPDSAGRAELETAVRRHFARTKVNEQEVIRGFVRQLHK